MTLRVTLSIVPFGDEADIRNIHEINISNLGQAYANGNYRYGVEVDKYKTGEYDAYVSHKRDDGPIALVALALKEVVNG
jgi:hypothetical protein